MPGVLVESICDCFIDCSWSWKLPPFAAKQIRVATVRGLADRTPGTRHTRRCPTHSCHNSISQTDNTSEIEWLAPMRLEFSRAAKPGRYLCSDGRTLGLSGGSDKDVKRTEGVGTFCKSVWQRNAFYAGTHVVNQVIPDGITKYRHHCLHLIRR